MNTDLKSVEALWRHYEKNFRSAYTEETRETLRIVFFMGFAACFKELLGTMGETEDEVAILIELWQEELVKEMGEFSRQARNQQG